MICSKLNRLKHFLKAINDFIFYGNNLNSKQLFSTSSINVFDRKTKQIHKEISLKLDDSHVYDYLKDEIAYRVADRVYDIKRRFPLVVDLGCYKGLIGNHLSSDVVDCLIYCDTSAKCLEMLKPVEGIETIKLVIDEEKIPFKEDSIDLVLSSLSMHWINDLPNAFSQILKCLKKDGALIASMFGGQTLFELRCSLQMAELEREGGFGPHISPFVTAQDIGSLLNRSGYTMLTIDTDEIKVNYPTIFELMNDLKGMAENNALINRKKLLHRDTLLSAAAIYQTLYGNSDGTIPATFQIFYLIGWKPHPSQQQPAQRGSANFSLKDIANIDQILKSNE